MSDMFNHEAEQSVIASAVVNRADIAELCGIVSSDDFHDMHHQAVWAAVSSMAAAGSELDLVTLSGEMERMGTLSEVGGVTGLAEMCHQAHASTSAAAYAEIVANHAVRRRIMSAMREHATQLMDNGRSVAEVIDAMHSHIGTLLPSASAEEMKLAREYLDSEFITPLDRRMQGIEDAKGLPTGLRDLDAATNGMKGNNLIILAGRPGMGKSAMMMSIAGANLSPETPVLVESLEMRRDKILGRLISCVGNTPLSFIDKPAEFDGEKQQQYFNRMAHPVNQIQKAALYINDDSGVTMTTIRQRCQVIKERHGKVGLVMIDYLSKVRTEGSHSRHDQAIGDVAIKAKAIARDFDCTVILLAQLNRGVEQRPNKRPMLSDLKDSGDVEQEADEIWFIYRDEYYNKDNPDNKGVAEIIRAKAREGETCTIHIRSNLSHARFEDLPISGDSW